MNANVSIQQAVYQLQTWIKVFWVRPFVSHIRAKCAKLKKMEMKEKEENSGAKRVKSEPGTKTRKWDEISRVAVGGHV